ncbi:MAG: FecR domain-containing protein [Ferruginibacter sp.]
MEKEERFLILVGKELSGSILSIEQTELTALIQQNPLFAKQYKQILQNWQAAENLGNDFNPDAQAAWQKINRRLETAPMTAKTAFIKPMYRYLSYAASVLVICITALYLYQLFAPSTLKVATTEGERKKLILPDHSTVWLNEFSSLEYAKNFNGQSNRLVKLEGEAFFEVTKNPEKRFIVEAGSTKTQVYGTSFNVKALVNENLQVALLEGKVSFSDLHNNWTETLKPGELAYINKNGQHGKRMFTDTNFMFWKNHALHFSNQGVRDVLAIIGNSYHTKFILLDSTIARQKISTTVKGDSVQQAIDVLQVLLDVDIVKKGDSYIVQPKQ